MLNPLFRKLPKSTFLKIVEEKFAFYMERLRYENERLRAENALLKKVRALVEEREARLREIGRKPSKN